jgi:hypothetical protein
MLAACTMDMLATDIADYLVRKGVSAVSLLTIPSLADVRSFLDPMVSYFHRYP